MQLHRRHEVGSCCWRRVSVTDLEERADGLETADDVQRKAVVCQHVANEPVRLVDDRRLVARRRRLLQHVNTKQQRQRVMTSLLQSER